MYQLFKNNNNFNSDISFWDTASVTTMFEMFLNANAFNRQLETGTPQVLRIPEECSMELK